MSTASGFSSAETPVSLAVAGDRGSQFRVQNVEVPIELKEEFEDLAGKAAAFVAKVKQSTGQ